MEQAFYKTLNFCEEHRNLNLNATSRNVTSALSFECLHQSIFAWIPSAFILFFSPLEIYWLTKIKINVFKWSALNTTRMVLQLILIVLTIADLSYVIHNYHQKSDLTFLFDIYVQLLIILSNSLVLGYFVLEKQRGLQSSGILFFFWLLQVLVYAISFRNFIVSIIEGIYFYWILSTFSSVIYLPFALTIFLLLCKPDPSPVANERNMCPEENASFLSKIYSIWFDKIIWHGFSKSLELKDLWKLNRHCDSQFLIEKFNKSVHDRSSKYFWLVAALRSFVSELLSLALLRLIAIVLIFSLPYFLKGLIDFVANKDTLWKGVVLVLAIFTVNLLQSALMQIYVFQSQVFGLKMKSIASASVYQKILRLSLYSKSSVTSDEMLNLVTIETEKICASTLYWHFIWSEFAQIFISFCLLWQQLGVATLAGVFVILFIIGVAVLLTKYQNNFQKKQMGLTGSRMKLMNEILNGIKTIKLYGWENSFEGKMNKIREEEILHMKKLQILKTLSSFIFIFLTFLISAFTFSVFVLAGNTLTPSVAFVSLTLINCLKSPLSALPNAIAAIAEALVAQSRIGEFLNLEESPDLNLNNSKVFINKYSILLENAYFSWKDQSPLLKSINLCVQKGSFVAVIGPIGCGKSSLISALIGDMHPVSGITRTQGIIATVPQQPFILNATFRDNILFGKEYIDELYNQCIDNCCLRPDVNSLPAKDDTEIGEKGVNLSGGQKQRVNLARAIYNDADIYLLDDPISAFDPYVRRRINQNVLGKAGVLKDKTRVVATHCLSILPNTDLIVMMNDGKITDVGAYLELLGRNEVFAEFMMEYLLSDKVKVEDMEDLREIELDLIQKSPSFDRQLSLKRSRRKSLKKKLDFELNKDKFINEESILKGQVSIGAYLYYLKNFGFKLLGLMLVLYMSSTALSIGTNLWLKNWSDDFSNLRGLNKTMSSASEVYIGIYWIMGMGYGILNGLGILVFTLGCLLASSAIHWSALKKVLKAPMSYFSSTPSNLLLNSFSSDIFIIDDELIVSLRAIVALILEGFIILFIISINIPIFAVVSIVLCGIFGIIQLFYIRSLRQLQRLEAVTRSYLTSHFSEIISGFSIIKAYKKEDVFQEKFYKLINQHQTPVFYRMVANKWLGIRLGVVSNFTILIVTTLVVYNRDNLTPGSVGLVLSSAFSITTCITLIMNLMGNLEANVIAVDRLKNFKQIPSEGFWAIRNSVLSADWPDNGQIVFQNFSARYRKEFDCVLKNLNFTIEGGEMIGVVGRSGVGKSSLAMTIFRIIETAAGKIEVDDIDISKIGLHDLRKRIAIIPQDRELFNGTLRDNLDPLNEHADGDIWSILKLVNFFDEAWAKGLHYAISNNGKNLSLGQKLQICLARALLKKSKILILDEGTASIDAENNYLIHRIIRQEFKNCTIIIIAHRLNTIIDCDKVLVLDNGTVKEFDNPQTLIKNSNSLFTAMLRGDTDFIDDNTFDSVN